MDERDMMDLETMGWAMDADEELEASPPCKHLLGPKHSGMRISCEGLLGRVRDDSRGYVDKGTRWAIGELLRHLEEVGRRYYAGDAQVVDEFLQLYCLDEGRP